MKVRVLKLTIVNCKKSRSRSFRGSLMIPITTLCIVMFAERQAKIAGKTEFVTGKKLKRESPINHNQRLSRACIVHLVIKRTNWSYVKTMSCSGSHLGITINIKNTTFVKDLPMIDAQFRFNQCNSFREEYISAFSPYGHVLILHRCQPLFGAISNKKLRCQ